MRSLPALLLLTAASLATQAAEPTARAPATPIHADKVILVGDSTTAVGSGWGAAFCADHVSSFLACVNLARGGRSTYNYRAEGSWDIALHEMRSGGYEHTWVLIQFGHNDQPGKPGRSTDLASEFPANLRRYVEDVRAAGAIPVLVTPLTRRQFRDGRLLDDLAPWAEAIRQVAGRMQVPLVDLHGRSQALVHGMGPVLSMRLAQAPANAEQVAAAQTGTSLDAAATAPVPAATTLGPAAVPASTAPATPPRARTTPRRNRWASPSAPSTTPTSARPAPSCSPRSSPTNWRATCRRCAGCCCHDRGRAGICPLERYR